MSILKTIILSFRVNHPKKCFAGPLKTAGVLKSSCDVFCCQERNKFMTNKKQFKASPDIFTAETDRGLYHLLWQAAKPLWHMMRNSKILTLKCSWRKILKASRSLDRREQVCHWLAWGFYVETYLFIYSTHNMSPGGNCVNFLRLGLLGFHDV